MAVYVDRLRAWGVTFHAVKNATCHLTADTFEELEAFARSIGIPHRWRHSGSKEHYDLTRSWRKKAVSAGAIERR
ncbi:MAG: DUF4031 domain-containing protein [Endomicrobiales bacterium]